jgi:hypothetical protein
MVSKNIYKIYIRFVFSRFHLNPSRQNERIYKIPLKRYIYFPLRKLKKLYSKEYYNQKYNNSTSL